MDDCKTTVSEIAAAVPAGAEIIQWVDLQASYEGAGALIYKQGDLYYVMEYSHCSCNGPMEEYSTNGPEPSYELIRRHISGYILEAMPLLANEYGPVSP